MTVPTAILDHLRDHHVLGLCVVDAEGPWAASCFYAFDAAAMVLVVLTSATTRHGRSMAVAPEVAGTIAGQPERIVDIRGIQFRASAQMLEGEPRRAALDLYRARHPAARLMRSDVWALTLREVKYTDNKLVFGRKISWSRPRTAAV